MNPLKRILSEAWLVENSGDIFRDDETNTCLLSATGRGNNEDVLFKVARGLAVLLGMDFLKLAVDLGEWGHTRMRCPHCMAIEPYHENGCRWKALFERIRAIETMPDPALEPVPMPKTRKKTNKVKHKARVRAVSKKLEAERKTEQRKAKKAAA